MNYKPFLTIDEQIELLRSRGLTIDDENAAKRFLSEHNYYRVSGYSLTLRHNNQSFESASFQNIIDIYNFDHELRHILLTFIEIIEVRIKSVYAYEFAQLYGPLGYLNDCHFTNTKEYGIIIKKVEELKKSRVSHEAFLKHYINELKQDLPLWAYVELLTISDISILYSISDKICRRNIAAAFNLTNNKGADILAHYLHSMTIIRNLCAHGSRLFNRLFEQKPSLNRKEQALLIKDKDGIIDNSHLYGFILVMKRLLSENQFSDMKEKIIDLTIKIPFVRMDYYGFRNDWQDVL
ncbi:MAG: Abi family protein [bacterium]|nr:Abi family protein [bacterium]